MNDEHGRLRVQLGAFVLGHLDPDESAAVQAHLDGCAECRNDVAAIAPLRARLDTVDPARLDQQPVTPHDLGERIFDVVRREQAAAIADDERRRRHSLTRNARIRTLGLVAATMVAVFVGFGAAWALKPGAPELPLEAVAVEVVGSSALDVTADLVPHTWGMEIKLSGSGFRAGEAYVVDVVAADGTVSTAGAFIGIGDGSMDCNLNSSVLRDDATGFAVRDEAGDIVLTSSF